MAPDDTPPGDGRDEPDAHTSPGDAGTPPAEGASNMQPTTPQPNGTRPTGDDLGSRPASRDFVTVRISEVRLEIADLRTEMRTEFANVRTEIADLRTELKTEIADLRTEMRTEFAKVRTEIADLRTELTTAMEVRFSGVDIQLAQLPWRLVRAMGAAVGGLVVAAGAVVGAYAAIVS